MKILTSVPVVALIHAGIVEILSTVIFCYILAVVNGHVPVWLPMISDCAVYPPEKYPFRLGVVIGASFLALHAVICYYANNKSTLTSSMAAMAVIASTSLAVVGVVNEDEDGNVHDFAAVLFFVCYDLYALLTLYVAWYNDKVPLLSYVIKFVTTIIYTTSVTGYLTFMYLNLQGSLFLAIFEWLNTFTLMIFLWSFVLDDLINVHISEIDLQSRLHTKTNNQIEKNPLLL